jgi:hypothetical protein
MNNSLKVGLIVFAVLVGAAILVAGGVVLGRSINQRVAYQNYPSENSGRPSFVSPGMMGGGFFGRNEDFQLRQGGMGRRKFFDRPKNQQLPFQKWHGMMGQGLLNNQYSGEPVSIDEARSTFETWLASAGYDNLQLSEIMTFSQNAYAVVSEKSSGRGAMEVLLDYPSGRILPEPGPNHMWNQKYGKMGLGKGAFGCSNRSLDNSTFNEHTVSEGEAQAAAQDYLDANEPGAKVAGEGIAFYGYYTFDFSKEGSIAGMLSVNGFTAQVWPHTWHGQFVDEWELN